MSLSLSPAAASRMGSIVIYLFLAGLSCTNSGLGRVDTSLDTDALREPIPKTCPWEGTWVLSQASCGSFLIPDWQSTYTDTRIVFTDDGNKSCNITFSTTGEGCAEEEAWTLNPASKVECPFLVDEEDPTVCYDVVSAGITTCTPDACVFDIDNDAACTAGDRAATFVVALDESVEGELDINGLLDHAWPPCSLELVSHWIKQ